MTDVAKDIANVAEDIEAFRQFAEERSHRDSGIANEHARATGQAIILINGGAATAILAFLAKDKLDASVLRMAPWCLIGYALGVIAGAFMLFSSIRSLEEYSMYWRLIIHPDDTGKSITRRKIAWIYQLSVRLSFIISVLAFFYSSCFLAYVLTKSIPPQQIMAVTPY